METFSRTVNKMVEKAFPTAKSPGPDTFRSSTKNFERLFHQLMAAVQTNPYTIEKEIFHAYFMRLEHYQFQNQKSTTQAEKCWPLQLQNVDANTLNVIRPSERDSVLENRAVVSAARGWSPDAGEHLIYDYTNKQIPEKLLAN